MRGSRGQFRVEAVSGQWWAVHVPSGAAPGYRDYGRTVYEGVAGNVGGEGTVWSASVPSGTQGMNLNFHVSCLYPSNANYRGYGFLLRCLSE